MGNKSRAMALRFIIVFLFASFIGSIAPESGNIVAGKLNLYPHIFNVGFLIVGFAGFGLALYLRLGTCR
jgi:hypothetical protein